MTILNNSNCDKTQIVTEFKLLQNTNCDKPQSVKEKNSKTQIVTKLSVREKKQKLNVTKIQIVTKLEDSNYDLKNSNYDNSNKSNCDT